MTQRNPNDRFGFNPGKTLKVFPPKHPYYPKGCGNCTLKLAFNANSEQCRVCTILQQCWKSNQKNEEARKRIHYLHQMEHLLKKRVVVHNNGHIMSVEFRKYGNKHLYSDTFGRSKTLQKEDLTNVNKLLEKATFVKKVGLSKPRHDNIKRFYYYQAELHGKTVYLNVAEMDYFTIGKGFYHARFLYSITDKIK